MNVLAPSAGASLSSLDFGRTSNLAKLNHLLYHIKIQAFAT